MTVITYDDHCYSDVKPYEVIIYTDDGDVLYHGKTKPVVLEGTADLSKIKGGKGEPIIYQDDIPWRIIGYDLSNRE